MFDFDHIYARQPDALLKQFGSLAEWQAFSQIFTVTDRARMKAIADRAVLVGVDSIQFGTVPDVTCLHDSPIHYNLSVNGMSNTERALSELIAATRFGRQKEHTRIFAGEALSAFAMHLRATYPLFIGTQYMPDAETQRRLFPIQHQDLTRLTFPDESFDIVTTIEVLEHVPYLDRALSEMARVLAPGGLMLSTFPFNWNTHQTLAKAELVDGTVHHLVDTPEIHGNPMSEEGALVFNIPGWDVIDLAIQSGFTSAKMVFYSSAIGGIFGSDLIGRFVFAAEK